MTSRAVFIDLKARTAQYQRAMKKAENATTGVQKSLGSMFTGAAKLGVVGAAVGVAAIGAAAIKVGIDAARAYGEFETTMSRITGLVGVSKEAVAGFADAIGGISQATARGPQELAEALFFITSAGLEGQDALDALESSARAATAGLGDTATIADVVTSAVNAYGPAMGGAAAATDVLVATVREGKAEAASLSAAMGRVIPIASQMGISFDQVGAAIAAMTRVGLDANEASTGLRAIMNSLLKPTTDAAKALDEVGLSAAGLREEIREKGLFTALESITAAFQGQDDATVRVFGNVRALTGVLSLMGTNAGATKQIFEELASSTGALDVAFEAAADTGAFAFEQAKVRIENAMLAVGEEILPKLADAMDDIAPLLPGLVAAFGDLALILTDLGASAIPPVVDFFDSLPQHVRGVQKIVSEWKKLSSTVQQFATLGFAEEAFDTADRQALKFLNTQIKVTNALEDGLPTYAIGFTALREMAEGFTITESNLVSLQAQIGFTDTEMVALTTDFSTQATAVGLNSISVDRLDTIMGAMAQTALFAGSAIGGTSEHLSGFELSMGRTSTTTGDASEAVEGMVLPLHLVRDALQEAEAANRSLADAMLEMVNPTFKAVKAIEALDSAEAALEKVRKKAGKRPSVSETEAIAQAELAVVEATLKAQGALDAFGFDPTTLEASLQTIGLVLGKSRDEAILLLETLGILDGTQVRALLEIETRVTGPLAGALGRTGLSDFELRGIRGAAHGGAVRAGEPVIVGERGRELWIPDQAGQIVPNNTLNQSSSRSVVVEINGAIFSSDVDVQAAVQAGLIAGGVTESVEWAGSTTIR